MDKAKKPAIYCGSGKKRNENWITATINVDKIKDHIQEYNGSKFVKVNIRIKPEPDQYGKDVSIAIDTWAPGDASNKENDLPF
jgi:hypothetical protein